MKTKAGRLARYAVINIFLFAMIIGLYFLASNEDIQTALDSAAGFPVYHGSRGEKAVALECCIDGDADHLRKILQVLKKDQVRMTFFMSSSFAACYPELMRQTAKEGHEIGMLGSPYKPRESNAQRLAGDITLMQSIILGATGKKPVLYMPFSVRKDAEIDEAVKLTGCKTVLFTTNALSIDDRQEQILQIASGEPANGDIIMLYPTKGMIETLTRIIYELRRKGYDMEITGSLIRD
jgi:peptidoglycan/xylan/chitin deacetylase (PgdA/CDA1 family)